MSKKKHRFGFDSEFELDSEETVEVEEIVVEAPVKPKMPFAMWFSRLLKKGRIRAHQETALLVFLKKQGLSLLEDADLYEETFKKF